MVYTKSLYRGWCLGLMAVMMWCVSGVVAAEDEHAGHAHGEQAHAVEEGPHHGLMLEFDCATCHGELVIDATVGTATLYVYTGKVGEPLAIEAPAVTLAQTAGKQSMVLLKPARQAGDPEGKASVFAAKQDELKGIKAFEGKLIAKINAKNYSKPVSWKPCDHDHGAEKDHQHEGAGKPEESGHADKEEAGHAH